MLLLCLILFFFNRLLVLEVMLAALSELTENIPDGHTDAQSSSPDLAISAANLQFIADDVKAEFSEILKLESPQYTDQEVEMCFFLFVVFVYVR